MTRRILWLLLLIVSVQLIQAQENFPKSKDCTVTVWAKNPISKEIVVDITPISLILHPTMRDQRKMPLDDKNKGALKISLKSPSIIKLMNARQEGSVSFVAIPGVDLVIHLDGLDQDTTKYNDVGQKENDFYNYALTRSRELLKAIPQQDPKLFLSKWEQELRSMQEFAAAAGLGMSPGYTSWISESIQSLFQSELCRQLVNYVTMTQQWPANFEEYTSKISSLTLAQFNQPNSFTRETDKELVETYYQFYSLIQDKKNQLPAPGAETNYRNAINFAKNVKAESSRNIMLRYLVTSATDHTTDTSFLNWMKKTIVFDKQNEHLPKMITEKQNLLRKIGRDKPAPGFDAVDNSGNKFSYQNYAGKYLFIDIWATWCVPCKKEIPYLDLLKEKYAGQPIEFISVSIDKNISAWKEFVQSKGSKDQFLSMPGSTSSINKIYNADLIPTFVLIDPHGKIVNPDIFRPSDPKLIFLLDKLLGKNNDQSIQ